jgi:hypothetical protein
MKTKKAWIRTGIALAIAGSALAGAGAALAQVKIGVTLSATGPAASLGIPEKNTVALLPKEIGGKSVEWIVLDDGSDTSRAVQNTRKLIDEDHVDLVLADQLSRVGDRARRVGPVIEHDPFDVLATECRRQHLDRVLFGNAERGGRPGRGQRDADRDVGKRRGHANEHDDNRRRPSKTFHEFSKNLG